MRLEITNEETLSAVHSASGAPIPFYDDGMGDLYIYRTADFLVAVVRADSWGSAYEIIEDEILEPIPEDDIIEAYGFYVLPSDIFDREKSEYWRAMRDCGEELALFSTEQAARQNCLLNIRINECELVEGYSYQSNPTCSGIVQYCLNGERLEPLTEEIVEEECLTIETTRD